MKKIIIFIFLLTSSIFAKEELLLDSANTFSIVMHGKSASNIVQNAKAILIFPSAKKVGFIIGGMFGEGVAVVGSQVMKADISNASLGFQIGYEDSYLVVFIMSDKLLNDIQNSKITLGGDVTATALNATANLGTLNAFSDDIYVFTNKSGVFVGASLGGVVLEIDGSKIYSQSSYGYTNLMEAVEKAK